MSTFGLYLLRGEIFQGEMHLLLTLRHFSSSGACERVDNAEHTYTLLTDLNKPQTHVQFEQTEAAENGGFEVPRWPTIRIPNA